MDRSRNTAFTLIEVLVAVGVLGLLVVFLSKLVSSASTVAMLGHKRLDVDSQVRPVLDRLALDLNQMIKRTDVDYYIKGADVQTSNDRMAFFTTVAGYYPSPGSQSPISLVSYRINGDSSSASFNRMERMGKGLLWNGVSTTYKPVIFGTSGTLTTNWPYVTSNTSPDPDGGYELVGQYIFRFEYFYLLKTGMLANAPGSAGMQDVAAVVITLAAIDPMSRVLLSDSQISTLSGRLKDFDLTRPGYDLTTSWQAALDATNDMARQAVNGIRIYQRTLYLTPSNR